MRRFKGVLHMAIYMLLAQISFAQVKHVKFEQLDSLQNVEKRHVIVFLHTSWCKYCATMENTTFKKSGIQELLNQNFYFVSLDIEEKNAIHFRGHIFKYKPTGATTGVHELAEQLGYINGELAYPTTCILNADFEIVFQKGGFIQSKELLEILKKLK